jgi:hypothetical protein
MLGGETLVVSAPDFVNRIWSMKTYQFPAIIEQDEDGYFIGIVPDLKGCHTQARSLSKLNERLKEAISLCLSKTC